MAAIVEENGHAASSNIKEFILIGLDNLAKLPRCGVEGSLNPGNDWTINEPVAYGSRAVIKDNGEIHAYMLFPDNVWTKV